MFTMKTYTLLIAILGSLSAVICPPVSAEERVLVIGLAAEAPKSISIEIDGVKYEGHAIAIGVKSKLSGETRRSYSPLVLAPAVGESVKVSYEMMGPEEVMTMRVAVNGEAYYVTPRRLCLTDKAGTYLKMLAGRIPLEAYGSEEQLKAAIRALFPKAQ